MMFRILQGNFRIQYCVVFDIIDGVGEFDGMLL